MNEVWMLYYLDHDGSHPVLLFSDEFKANYTLTQIQNMEGNPLPVHNEWHDKVDKSWFKNGLVVERYEVY